MDNIKSTGRIFLLFLLIIGIFIRDVLAFPVLPSQFYGEIIIDGKFAQIGTNISAYDTSGILCGSCVVEKKGENILSCKGDNPTTAEDEGAGENEFVIVYVNNKSINPEAEWHSGEFSRLDLIIGTQTENMVSDPEYPSKEKMEYPSKERISPIDYILIILFLVIIVFVIVMMKKQESEINL